MIELSRLQIEFELTTKESATFIPKAGVVAGAVVGAEVVEVVVVVAGLEVVRLKCKIK